MNIRIEITDTNKPYAVIYTNKITPEVQQAVSLLDTKSELITANDDEKIIIIQPTEIYMIRIENSETIIYCESHKYRSKKRLYELLSLLGKDFMQISKSAVINLNHKFVQNGDEINKEDLAASFQHVAIESIISKTKKALVDNNIKNLIVAGGVAANQGLREEVEKLQKELDLNVTIPSMKYCTDNATMIAAAGYYAYKLGRRADLSLNSKSSDKLN